MMAAALQIIRHGKTISVCHFLARTSPRREPRTRWTPVFCANRRNYPREKIAKNATVLCFSLSLSFFSSAAPLRSFSGSRSSFSSRTPFHPFFPRSRRYGRRTNTHNDTSFRGDSCSSCYSSFIGANITDTGYKSDGNDFGQEC